MNIWAVANQKGGVGKTTTALALAGLAVDNDQRVLLVDTDPHGSLTAFFRLNPDDVQYGCFTLFEQRHALNQLSVRRCIRDTSQAGLSILPASSALASIDRQPTGPDGMGLVLKNALACIDNAFDLIIIDGPPMAGVLLVNAILAARHLIIPVQTEFLALQGLARMLRTLSLLGKHETSTKLVNEQHGARNKWPYLIVPTLYDRRTHASLASLENLRKQHGSAVWTSQVTMDTKLRDAMERGVLPHRVSEESGAVAAYRLLLENLMRGDDNNVADRHLA